LRYLRGETSPPLLTGALRKNSLKLILQKIALLSRLFKISGKRREDKVEKFARI